MRRVAGALAVVLLVAWISFGGGITEWANDGTYDYSSAIVVQNVSDRAAVVNVVYQTPCDPTTPDYQVTVPAGSSGLVNVNDAFPGPWSGSAIVTSDVPIIANQNYVWHVPYDGTQWAANEGGVLSPSTTWYLAEGSTYGGFESYVCVQNPSEQSAQVEIAYTTPGASHAGPAVSVDPVSSLEIPIKDTLTDYSSIGVVVTSDQPVVAQLSTYWNGGASYTSTHGASQPANTWYVAEGSTSSMSGFETWITVQNPTPSPADVSVTYIADGQQIPGPQYTVAPMTHDTFNTAGTLPDQSNFAAMITSDQPIVAVQSMRWDGHQGFDSTTGVPQSQQTWHFPLVRPTLGASSWLAVQNVGDASSTVTIDYVSETGTTGGGTLDVDPFGRGSLSLPEKVGGSMWYSAVVTSDQPIVAMVGNHWETSSGSHRDIGFGVSQTATQWYLPTTPHAPSWSESSFGESSAPSTGTDDRDGDGVPDDQDMCPDYPGDPSMDGC